MKHGFGAASYTQDDVAYGINTATEFYNAWPYNSGVDLGGVGESGFLGAYTDDDMGPLGQSAKLMGNFDAVTAAMASMAASWGQSEPALSDYLAVMASATNANALPNAITGAASNAVQTAGNAVSALPSDVMGLASFVTSPSFLILGGLVLGGVVLFMFYPELKEAAGAGSAYLKKQSNPKRRKSRKKNSHRSKKKHDREAERGKLHAKKA